MMGCHLLSHHLLHDLLRTISSHLFVSTGISPSLGWFSLGSVGSSFSCLVVPPLEYLGVSENNNSNFLQYV